MGTLPVGVGWPATKNFFSWLPFYGFTTFYHEAHLSWSQSDQRQQWGKHPDSSKLFFGKSSKVKIEGLGKLLNSYTWIQGISGGYILTNHLGWPDVTIICPGRNNSSGKTNMKVVASGWKIANQIDQQKKSVTQSRPLLREASIANQIRKLKVEPLFGAFTFEIPHKGAGSCVLKCAFTWSKLGIISIIHLKNKLPCISYQGKLYLKICLALKVVTNAPSSALPTAPGICHADGYLTISLRRTVKPIDVEGVDSLEIPKLHRNWGSWKPFYPEGFKFAKLKSLTLRNWEWEQGT